MAFKAHFNALDLTFVSFNYPWTPLKFMSQAPFSTLNTKAT